MILAKGLDFKMLFSWDNLSRLINNIPDYRSPERTFQLITQVSGRAEKVWKKYKILQTYQPEDDTIKSQIGDYGFVNKNEASQKT